MFDRPGAAVWRREGGRLLASVPVVIAYAFLMDYSVSGLVAGATKY